MAASDGRGPAAAHVHEPELVYSGGVLMGRVCRCGEPYDVDARPVAQLSGKKRDRALEAHRRVLEAAGGE